MRAAFLIPLVVVACEAHAPPPRDTPDLAAWQPGQVKEAMAILGEAALPMFAQIERGKLARDDFAALERRARTVETVTKKLNMFYGFNDVAQIRRNEVAKQLTAAATARDEPTVRARLAEMLDDCRQCHRVREVRPAGRQVPLP
jgi:hypothetical protein